MASDATSDEINMCPKDDEAHIMNQQCAPERPNSFSSIFGEYQDRSWLISVCYTNAYSATETAEEHKLHDIWGGNAFYANFFTWSLDAAYINRTNNYYGNEFSYDHQIFKHKYRRFYGELTTDINLLDSKGL